MFKETDEVQVWAGGSCELKPGWRAYAHLIVNAGGVFTQGSGGEAGSTNNRMDLFSAMQGIRAAEMLEG